MMNANNALQQVHTKLDKEMQTRSQIEEGMATIQSEINLLKISAAVCNYASPGYARLGCQYGEF